MKRFSIWGSLMVCLAVIFTFTACEEDGTGDNANPPILTLNGGANLVTTDTTVAPGTVLNFQINGLSGDNEMQNVRFLEDGELVTDFANRITVNGAPASSASILLFDEERNSFTWDITWEADSSDFAKTYTFEVVDVEQNASSQSIVVNTEEQFTTPLAVTLEAGVGCIVTDIPASDPAPLGTTINFCVTATRDGEAPLSTIAVVEDGAYVDISRLEIDDVPFSSNPSGLFEGDENGFSRQISVVLPSTYGTTHTYYIELTNTAGTVVNSSEVNVTMESLASDVSELTGILLNAAGPDGQGGLDLSTGNGNINSGAADSDIKDAGIDNGLPNAQNWKQEIEPVNGSTLRIPNTSSEFYTPYNNVQYQSEITENFNSATTVGSSTINVGTEVLVQTADGVIYHLICTDVTVTPDDNNDSYTFSYKY